MAKKSRKYNTPQKQTSDDILENKNEKNIQKEEVKKDIIFEDTAKNEYQPQVKTKQYIKKDKT